MRKNAILITLSVLLFTCCVTSLKNIKIKKVYLWLADVNTKQAAKAVIPRKVYLVLAAVRTTGGEDIYDINMDELSLSSPDTTLNLIKTGNARFVRVRPDSFIFTGRPRVTLKAEVPSHNYAEEFSWPIDWKHYDTLDFSPDAEVSACMASDRDLVTRAHKRRIPAKDANNVDMDCSFYEVTNENAVEKYIVLYERNLKLLYAFPAAKKITIKTDGRNGKDGEDGGNAGDITARYYADSDITKFLIFTAKGGSGGQGGWGGKAYEDGEAGQKGRQGSSGRDGQINEYREHNLQDMFHVSGYPEFDRRLLSFHL